MIYITALIVSLSGDMTLVQHKQGFEIRENCQQFLSNKSAVEYMEKSLFNYYGTQLKEVKGFSCMTQEEAFNNNKQIQESQEGSDI